MSEPSLQPWEVLTRRESLDRRPWFRLWDEDVRLPDGRVIENFTTIGMPDYVVVVALTAEGRVVAERSYKHGPRRVCLMLPAGYIEAGEEPLRAAQRELLEETGYTASVWSTLGSFTVDGNRGCGRAHLFLARQAEPVAPPDAGDLEEMEILTLPPTELLAALRQGEVELLAMAAALGLALLA